MKKPSKHISLDGLAWYKQPIMPTCLSVCLSFLYEIALILTQTQLGEHTPLCISRMQFVGHIFH